MNTIQLQTTIAVRTFDAPTTVAIGRKRPEWLAVARLAKDFGGAVHAEQITSELLDGVPPVLGNRVIDRCVALGMLERTDQERKDGVARLSTLGEAALEQGQVFVPEERLWRFYFAEDPLVDQMLLHVEPLDDGRAQDERSELREAKKPGNSRQEASEPFPESLRTQATGSPLHSVADGEPSFALSAAPQFGVRGKEESLRLQLTWESDGQPQILLQGELIRPRRRNDDKKPAPLKLHHVLKTPELLNQVTHEQIWMLLVSLGAGVKYDTLAQWRQRTKRLVLPSGFSGLGDAALSRFRADVSVPAIQHGLLPGVSWLEGFNPGKLTEVELVPASDADAQSWAEWWLRDSLTDYATPTRLECRSEPAPAIKQTCGDIRPSRSPRIRLRQRARQSRETVDRDCPRNC